VSKAIVWQYRDFRVHDNPALSMACKNHPQVYPVFLWDPDAESPWPPGEASRAWLAESISAYRLNLHALNMDLTLAQGPINSSLMDLCLKNNIQNLYYHERWEPHLRLLQEKVIRSLRQAGIQCHGYLAHLLHDPTKPPVTKSGDTFKVFTPFSKTLLSNLHPRKPLSAPSPRLGDGPRTLANPVADLGLSPTKPWVARMLSHWQVGESHARRKLANFVKQSLHGYGETRDFPAAAGTSRLSPHLHFGEISPYQVWEACLQQNASAIYQKGKGAQTYIGEILWREFNHYILQHYPRGISSAYREEYAHFPWNMDADVSYEKWTEGRTGFPIIDAGMRELWETGWMHNRVRMIVASFLVKHLGKSWLMGAKWFWDTLVDADLANNIGGWQWSAGCGMDGAPYFRIFNPTLQGKRFDPHGQYIKTWVPELSHVPAPMIHEPWDYLQKQQRPASDQYHPYPMHPMLDHGKRRGEILASYKLFREGLREGLR
jgi:deoxyribodipyrimidine photo-lyase